MHIFEWYTNEDIYHSLQQQKVKSVKHYTTKLFSKDLVYSVCTVYYGHCKK